MSGLLQNDSNVTESRRVILAFVLAFGLYAAWTIAFPPPVPPPIDPTVEGSESPVAAAPEQPAPNSETSGNAEQVAAVADVQLSTGLVRTRFSNTGGRLTGVTIEEPVQYIPHPDMAGVFPDVLDAASAVALPLDVRIVGLPDLTATSRFTQVEPDAGTTEANRLVYSWRSPDGQFEVRKQFVPSPDSFATNFELTIVNLTANERGFDGLEVSMGGMFDPEAGGSIFGQGDSVLENLCVGAFGVERERASGLDEPESFTGTVSFVGVDERYFLTALVPGEAVPTQGCVLRPVDETHTTSVLLQPRFTVPPNGQSITYAYTLYTGPKDQRFLGAVNQELSRSIDLGWFSFLAVPIRMLLLFFQGWVVNWGLAIILLVMVIKLALYPVTQKSFESMEKMRLLQPRIAELQKKYENDRMKLAEAQMALFKSEGASPLGGCLPMLLQMPIYFALYRTIWGSAELFNAPFFLWITDLSAKDPYFVLPLLCGVVMYGQQKLMPPQQATGEAAEIMKTMTRIMPGMFTVFMIFLPSGLTLYILVNMILSIAQQMLIRRRLEARQAK